MTTYNVTIPENKKKFFLEFLELMGVRYEKENEDFLELSDEHKEDEENKIIALKKAIQEGIDSGIAHDFDPIKNLENLKARRIVNGKI